MKKVDYVMAGTLAALAVMIGLIGPISAVLAAEPRADAPVLVIAPRAGAVVEAAGGYLLGPERAPLAALASTADENTVLRFKAAGAWAVLDASRIAAWCGIAPRGT